MGNVLPGALERIRSRLRAREDSEHAQVLVRIVITALFCSYLGWQLSETNGGPALYLTWLFLLGELAISFVLLASILLHPAPSHARRWIGMLADYTALAAVMYLEGETATPLYAVYLWVTIGNGLRYGPRYLKFATALASASFLLVIRTTPYWLDNLYLSWGLLGGLVAVPLYFNSLLKALTRAMEDARRANEAKSRFLANMSHEFRTPLNGLAGTCDLMATTRLDAEQRQYVSAIQASSRSLLALVEDVLDISAIEAGKIRLHQEPFSVTELVEGVGLILQPLARVKSLVYEVVLPPGLPPRVTGDASHLRQVLLNLLGNAIKFTDEGFVRLVVETRPGSGSILRVRFRIIDSGIGIAESARERLFQAFEQADATLSRRHGGTGLGTTIAKSLAEAMGGTIGFQSTERRGSEFWVELPFQLVADTVAVGPEADNVIAFSDPFLRHRARVEPMRIIIADDHAANRMVLQGLLQKAGHKVTAVHDGEALLDALEGGDFDVAIADLHMPRLSGVDMLRQLRAMQAGSPVKTPVMILSADVTPQSIEACERAGARAFLPKPVVAVRLLDALADIASGRRVDTASPPRERRAAGGTPMIHDPGMLEELRSLGMGGRFEADFIGQCFADAGKCLDAARKHARAGEWTVVKDHVHALKGVAGNLGLVLLAGTAEELMRQPVAQLGRDGMQRIGAMEAQLSEGREYLLEARGRGPGSSGSDVDGAM